LNTTAPHSHSVVDLKFGKSIHYSNFEVMSNGAIGTLERMVSAMPAPKAKKGKKKKKASAEEAADGEPGSPEGGKAKKKKRRRPKGQASLKYPH